jgi:2,3-bisphosphoglycerate-dependent phosphoglycerate mutase
MSNLVLVRHGQTPWNKKQIFTGWADVSLTEQGIDEVQILAKKLKKMKFDVMFTSRLERARTTLLIITSEQKHTGIFIHEHKQYNAIFDDKHNMPIFADRDLNERHYGLLQGMKKDYARDKFGEEQVHKWRRSYDVRPPQGESLKDVYKRVVPYFEKNIMPLLQSDKNILISAHGNSLRALIKYIDNVSDEDIVNLELSPGDAIFYAMKKDKLIKEEGEHEFTRPMEWK